MRTSQAIATLTLALLCAACVSDPKSVFPTPGTTVQLTEKQLATIREAAADYLFDPYSAQFEKLRAVRIHANGFDGNPRLVTCGYVNAKNRFGAYVGRTPFYAELDNRDEPTSAPFVLGASGSYNYPIRSVCAAAGLPFD